MVEINLLPWRKQQQFYQFKITVITLSISLLLSILSFYIIYRCWWTKVNELQSNVVQLRQQFIQDSVSDAEINNKDELGKLYHQYQSSIKLFSLLPLIAQQPACLTSVSNNEGIIRLQGFSQSRYAAISVLKTYENTNWFKKIRLEKITFQENTHKHVFSIDGETNGAKQI